MEISELYRRLLAEYGPQHWWPADSRLEVVAGAVLVQRTTWRNASEAVGQLKQNGLLTDCHRIAGKNEAELAQLVRAAGFFRVKARRLRNLMRAIRDAGGLERLSMLETSSLREFLLGVHGVGEETADAILLYAFGRPVVVIDAYYRRIWGRVRGLGASGGAPYDRTLRRRTEATITEADDLGELHALLVAHGKARCRPTPDCSACNLATMCLGATKPGRQRAYNADQVNPVPRRKYTARARPRSSVSGRRPK